MNNMLKIKGLKGIASETKNLKGYYSPEYLQLFYDKSNGETWVKRYYSVGHNHWADYADKNIINCGMIYCPLKMWEIKLMIEERLRESR